MSAVIYILTVVFVVYVIYMVIGDQIVAFIRDTFRIDLSHPHNIVTNLLNRIKKTADSR